MRLQKVLSSFRFSKLEVLVGLYEEPEKPGNALEFVQSHLTSVGSQSADVETLKAEIVDLKKQNEEVISEVCCADL